MEDSTKVVALGFLVALERREIWLAEKKTGIGSGKLNGYGGGCKESESIEDCMIREFREESGAETTKEHITRVGSITFKKGDGINEPSIICKCNIFFITNFSGQIYETEEMDIPTPFSFDGIPFNRMMPSDKLWLPQVLIEGKIVYGSITFDMTMKNVIENNLQFR